MRGRRRTPPGSRHAGEGRVHRDVHWLRGLRWTLVAVVAVGGTGFAFAYGLGLRANPVPPPAPAAPALAAEGAPVVTVGAYPLDARPTATVPLVADPTAAGSSAADVRAAGLAADGIPRTALEAYQDAAARESTRAPDCQLPWQLPAAIGRVESDHGRFGDSVLYSDGRSAPPIIGIPLDGNGTALIRDTDHGVLDGDRVYDHAVGPMQFIPSTWRSYGVDANGDGTADPFNVFDAAAAAADYLCAAGGDLSTARGQQRAVSAYNHSSAYVELVLRIERIYSDGALDFGAPADPTPPPDVPPANPGPPLSTGDPGVPPAGSTTTVTVTAAPGSTSAAPSSGGPPPSSGPPSSAPSTSDAPTTDVPSTDPPTSDPPTSDAPTTDAPTTDAPSTDTPATPSP